MVSSEGGGGGEKGGGELCVFVWTVSSLDNWDHESFVGAEDSVEKTLQKSQRKRKDEIERWDVSQPDNVQDYPQKTDRCGLRTHDRHAHTIKRNWLLSLSKDVY